MNLLKAKSIKSIVNLDGKFDHASIEYDFQLLDSISNLNIDKFKNDIFDFVNEELKGVINFYWHQVAFEPNFTLILKVGFYDALKDYPPYNYFLRVSEEERYKFLNMYPCHSLQEMTDFESCEKKIISKLQDKLLEYYDKTFRVSLVESYDPIHNIRLLTTTVDVFLNRNEAMGRGLLGFNSISQEHLRKGFIYKFYEIDKWEIAERMYNRLMKYCHRLNNESLRENSEDYHNRLGNHGIGIGEHDESDYYDEPDQYNDDDLFDDLFDGNRDAYWNID
ncbi:MAG: hypothetical protein IT261_03620 [Saprospiraceae bacterium]|nr:hypothetical protein [Saprospiraceae bacterium]